MQTFLFQLATTRARDLIFGGGIEWAFTPAWSVKAEYLRTDLDNNITYSVSNRSPTVRISLMNIDIARVGLNYHFR